MLRPPFKKDFGLFSPRSVLMRASYTPSRQVPKAPSPSSPKKNSPSPSALNFLNSLTRAAKEKSLPNTSPFPLFFGSETASPLPDPSAPQGQLPLLLARLHRLFSKSRATTAFSGRALMNEVFEFLPQTEEPLFPRLDDFSRSFYVPVLGVP